MWETLQDNHLYFLYYILLPIAITLSAIKISSFLKRRALFNRLPGPKLHPFWGSIKQFGNKESGISESEKYLRENTDDKFMRMRRGPFSYFIRIIDPELAGRVLSMGYDLAPKDPFVYSTVTDFLRYVICYVFVLVIMRLINMSGIIVNRDCFRLLPKFKILQFTTHLFIIQCKTLQKLGVI